MDILKDLSLYKINKIEDSSIFIENLLTKEQEKEKINWDDPCKEFVVGDIILWVKNKKEITEHNEDKDNKLHYPVQKVKGRFSDVKDYIYLKMKVLYDFNLLYLGKKEIEAVDKDPAHIKFEQIIDQNQDKIKKLITYNSDENVRPFNHTDYEVERILDSKKIFRQEIGDRYDWGWSLMEIYQLDQQNYVSYKQSSYFRERQRGGVF